MPTLVPQLLSARVRGEAPDERPNRTLALPFGLTLTRALQPDEAVSDLGALRYDPVRQLSVTPDGRPAVTGPGQIYAATHYDTQYDMQWFTDKD